MCIIFHSLSVDENLYAPLPGVEPSGEGMNGCHRIMHSSSDELTTPVSESAKSKQTKANTKMHQFPELMWVIKMAEW